MIKALFSNFEEMITPRIISVVFMLLVIFDFFSAIGVISQFFGGYDTGALTNIIGIIVGIFYFVFSVVVSRVLCELLMVIFKINEHTQGILKHLDSQ